MNPEPTPIPARIELAAALAISSLGTALLFAIGLIPAETLIELASKLSKDGELAPASLRAARAVSASALPLGLVCAGGILLRERLRRALASFFSQLERMPFRTFIPFLLSLSFLPRLLWVALIPTLPMSDCLSYRELSLRLLHSGSYITESGIPTAFRPPGYPGLLALLGLVFGEGLWAPKILNVLLGCGIAWLTYRIARTRAGESSARLAAMLVAIFPSLVGYSSLLCTEIVFTFMALGFLLLASRDEIRSPRREAIVWLAIGLWLGLVAMIRPTIALYPLFTFAIQWRRRGLPRAFLRHAIMGLGLLAVALPWGLRNRAELGAFVPFSTNAGVNFYLGNNPVTNGTGLEILNTPGDETLAAGNEVERNRLGFRLGWRYWREHPGRIPILMFRKIVMMMISDGNWGHWAFDSLSRPVPRIWPALTLIASSAFYYLALLGSGFEYLIFRWWRESRRCVEPYLDAFFLCNLATTALWIGQERYHFPILPVLCVAAAAFLRRISLNHGNEEAAWSEKATPKVRPHPAPDHPNSCISAGTIP